jgi:hypothetical protein
LKLMGETTLTPDDVFYYGVFCDIDTYKYAVPKNSDLNIPEVTGEWGTPERSESKKVNEKWWEDFFVSIIKGEIDQPQWMDDVEEADEWTGWSPSSYLYLVPKDEKFVDLGNKIKSLLNSVDADGGRDG